MSVTEEEQQNYAIFRDCFASPIISRNAPKPHDGKRCKKPKGGRKNITASTKPSRPKDSDVQEPNHAEDLADFIDYIATETFLSLPTPLRTLSYESLKTSPTLTSTYTTPLPPTTLTLLLPLTPPTVTDSLLTYTLLPTPEHLPNFLLPIYESYITTTTSPPPPLQPTQRASACEICDRDWIPLTYHHLIPKSVHEKVRKRGWHEEWELQRVAWLCRACHSFVHGVAGNEELARRWWSVELLVGREDVRRWGEWVGRVRWGKR